MNLSELSAKCKAQAKKIDDKPTLADRVEECFRIEGPGLKGCSEIMVPDGLHERLVKLIETVVEEAFDAPCVWCGQQMVQN